MSKATNTGTPASIHSKNPSRRPVNCSRSDTEMALWGTPMIVAVPPATDAYSVASVMNAAKFVRSPAGAPAIVQVCRTTDMPIGIVIAMVAASDTNIEMMPTMAM